MINQNEKMKKLTISIAIGNEHYEQDEQVCSFCYCGSDEKHDDDCNTKIARDILGAEWDVILLEIKEKNRINNEKREATRKTKAEESEKNRLSEQKKLAQERIETKNQKKEFNKNQKKPAIWFSEDAS